MRDYVLDFFRLFWFYLCERVHKLDGPLFCREKTVLEQTIALVPPAKNDSTRTINLV